MIIVDYNQVAIATWMVYVSEGIGNTVEEPMIRHMILNCILSYRRKYTSKYGNMVIACDDHDYWRKELFPYYKYSRKEARDADGIDWNALFQSQIGRASCRERVSSPV